MSKATPIPTRVRKVVKERDGGHCLRCGAAGANELHHRRRRGVGVDPHEICNIVTLCWKDHRWAHAHPEAARAQGFIVSMFDDEPFRVPVKSFMGAITLACDGGLNYVV